MNAEQEEPKHMECPECGSARAVYCRQPSTLRIECPDCKLKTVEYAEDSGGVMSVPWGFLL